MATMYFAWMRMMNQRRNLLVAEEHRDGHEQAEDAGPDASAEPTSARRPKTWVKVMARGDDAHRR